MKLVKSLLLGTVAGLAAVAGAQAADLPVEEGSSCRVRSRLLHLRRRLLLHPRHRNLPPRRRPCSRRLPVEHADPSAASLIRGRAVDCVGFRARGRIQLDARTATAYGLLRSFVRFEITRSSASPFGNTGAIATSPNVAQAFVSSVASPLVA